MPSERQIPNEIVSLSEKKYSILRGARERNHSKKKKCHCPAGNSKLSPVIKFKF